MTTVLFVCRQNAGRSQMSQALFARAAAGRHRAMSAGTTPAGHVHREVVTVMKELGIDLADRTPRLLTPQVAEQADLVVSMGCGDDCPPIPGRRHLSWDLPDPAGRPLDEVRTIRDEIDRRVQALVDEVDTGSPPPAPELGLDAVADRAEAVLEEVQRAVVGKREALELVLLALLADGHVLIEDNPGLAKTLIARSFAAVTGLAFARVQFTPDLMPSDITGASIFDQRTATFEFRPGPIFTNVLLGDEINRAPPKTQAALLEAMQERQVTSDDRTRPIERPFLVLATQNPIEYEGTYPLPEAQLDRFLIRVSVGYPSPEEEREMLRRRASRGSDDVELSVRMSRAELLAAQRAVESVHVDDGVAGYMVDLVAATRAHPSAQIGASPRGTLALLRLARARAAAHRRDYVTPDDVKEVATAALAHRVVLRPELWVQRVEAADVVRDCLRDVPVPAVTPPR